MKRIITIATAILTGLSALAQPALPFVKIDRNPVTGAMGGIEAVSPLFNPAMVPFAGTSDIIASYQAWAPGTIGDNYFNLLGDIRVGEKIGITAIGGLQMGKPYTITDATGAGSTTFRPSNMLFGAGFGYRFTESLGIGATLRFASEKLTADNAYSGVSADVLLVYRLGDITLSGGLVALGPPVKSGDSTFGQPTSLKLGAGYRITMEEGSLLVAADADYFINNGVGAAVGMEYGFKDFLFLRLGTHLGMETTPIPTHISLGLGVKLKGIHLDVSYLTLNNIIGNTLSAGLGYAF